MARVFIGIGSNIRPAENVREAVLRLAKKVRVKGISMVYQTEPEGRPEQPPYYNCVVEIETERPPRDLKAGILGEIEKGLGRQRNADKDASRTIDLDLILYGDFKLENEDLTLPDPLIRHRPYLAHSLLELAPDLEIPGWGRIRDIASVLPPGKMIPLTDYTASLRKEVLLGH